MTAHNDITGDAIQSKPNSSAFRDNFDGIFRKDTGKCQCSLRIKLVGDGCHYCNPKLAAEIEQDNLNDLDQKEE